MDASHRVLKLPSSGGEELGSCLPTEDVYREVPSVDQCPFVVRPAL